MLTSALYTGTVRHRRFSPSAHDFTYPVFQACLDIDRLPELLAVSPFTALNRFAWASFHDSDHFGDPALSLRARVEADAHAHGLRLSGGPIHLVTHLRYLGYCFNPISLFYCHTPAGRLEAILAEVRSTFGERHNYWLTDALAPGIYVAAKHMHVSPFLPMDMHYRFVLPDPAEKLLAHIEAARDGKTVLDATLTLDRQPWDRRNLHAVLRRFPCVTAKVIAAIHWEALALYCKRVPFFPKPASH